MTTVESYPFQAEAKQLLDLMIHSLYTQREIFLRELISNASDALDRLRIEALTCPRLVTEGHLFEIRLNADPCARTLTIGDSGIGMNREELVSNLGTIARSGTRELRERIKESPAETTAELIGQFGVGFYSCFMVANKVSVVTRRAGQESATRWESTGDGTYTIVPAEKSTIGTEIVLELKMPDPEIGLEDYTHRWKLASIVRRYSDLIPYPIIYDGGAEEPGQTETLAKQPRADGNVLNSMKPIWIRRQSDVTSEDYAEFYRHISQDWNPPMKVLPVRAEGINEYAALLFIPAHALEDLVCHGPEAGLRLYVRRVMVMENCDGLLPRYLRFVRGVVDAGDCPLNISRQRLQHDRHTIQIRKWLTRKILDLLAEMQAKDLNEYCTFWQQFGHVLKEGVTHDSEGRERLLRLLVFESSNDPANLTTLKSYVERMKPEQQEILYLTGESRKAIENSPHLEALLQKGYEILYLSDPVDELVVQHMDEFEGKRLKSVGKGIVSLGTSEENIYTEEQLNERQNKYARLLETLQTKLEEDVKQVRLSNRLVSFPACLVTEDYEYSPHLNRLLKREKGGGLKQRRIMEINAEHPIILRLYGRLQANKEDPHVLDSAVLLFGVALLAEGSEVLNPLEFTRLTLQLMEQVL